MSTPIKDYKALTAAIASLQGGTKSASSPMGSGDPTKGEDATFNVGTAQPKKTDGDNKGLQNLPTDGTQGKAKKDIATMDTKPGPVGENVPSVTEHKQVVEPNADFNTKKLAGEAKAIADRAAQLLNPKSAAAPSARPAVDNLIPTGDASFHFKLASFVLENEDVLAAVQTACERKAGAAEVMSTIKNAYAAHANFIADQNAQTEMEKQANYEAQMIKQAFDNATPAEQAVMVKFANAHQASRGLLPAEDLLGSYDLGVVDAEFILNYRAKSAGAMAGGAGAPPEGAGAGPEEMPPTGEFPGAGGTPGEEGAQPPSPEEILQVLQMLVQSGEIDQATAEQVAQHIMGGGAGGEGGAPGGEAGGAPGAGGPPAGGEQPSPEGGSATDGAAKESVEEDPTKKAAAIAGF